MEELLLSRDDLITMFDDEIIRDSNLGWIYEDKYIVNIVAVHEKEPKYIYDVSDAPFYKLVFVKTV